MGDKFFEDRRRERVALTRAEIDSLSELDNYRSAYGVFETIAVIIFLISFAVLFWHPLVLVLVVCLIASRQQALFVLAHDAAHYRLFKARRLNDFLGRMLAMPVGISMCTYRVIHRLHHNHLYDKRDPDIPLIAGYPRGQRYFLGKLFKDLAGLTAWKTFKYFFGAPVINDDAGEAARPLNDTAPHLRQAARNDRWWVLSWQVTIFTVAFMFDWWLEYLVLWLLPLVTITQMLLRFRAVLEHGAISDTSSALTAARTNTGPRWLIWLLFPHHVNFHIEHHLFPTVPYYNLPKCHALLNKKGALSTAEVRRLQDSLSLVLS